MFLLDTCVLSEGIRSAPDPAVIRWIKFQDPNALFISAVSLGELHFGVAKLPVGARRRELGSWVDEVERRFADRIIVLDGAAARQWGYLRAANSAVQNVDAQIAATALVYGLKFATRNVKHFRFEGLAVVNPWSEA